MTDEAPTQPVTDPSKNVLDIVNFERDHRDVLREADLKYQALEIKRLDDLAKQKDAFDLRQIASFSEQVDRLTSIFSGQIAELQRARYENAGKSVGIGMMITGLITVAGVAVAVTTLVLKIAGG